jgi:hypothetical protein
MIFHLLNHGHPKFEFEVLRELYCILKVKNNLKKHWTYGSGWGMVEAMHDIILTSIRIVVQGANFFFVSVVEVIIVDQCPCLYAEKLLLTSNFTNLGTCESGCNYN